MIAVSGESADEFAAEKVAMGKEELCIGGGQLSHDQDSCLVGRVEIAFGRSHRMKTNSIEAEALCQLHSFQAHVARSGRKSVKHFDVVVSVGAQIERFSVEQEHIAKG